MSAYEDFVAFVDSGSLVSYFQDNATYYPKPNIISIQFKYDFKTFYKSYNNYYVGVAFSKFVRSINASDFNMMKKRYEDSLLKSQEKRKQLSFNF